MNLFYPFCINSAKRSSITTFDEYVRQLIEQVLFTIPGERVNRPDFGSGILSQVFSTNNNEAVMASQFLLQANLQQWLNDVMQIDNIQVQTEESTIRITICYVVLCTREAHVGQFKYAL